MTPSNRRAISELVQIGDISLLFSCLGISYAFASQRRAVDLFNALETHRPVQVFIATAVLAIGWHIVLRSIGSYRSRRLEGYLKEIFDICSAGSLCAVFSFVWLLIVCTPSRHPIGGLGNVSILFGVLSVFAIVTTRVIGRATMHAFRSRGYNLRHILIVGTNRRSEGFVHDLELHPEWGYHLQGFVDSRGWSEETFDSDNRKLLGNFESIPDILRTMPVDEVIVALPIFSFYQQVAEIVALCSQHGIAVRSLGPLFEGEQTNRTAFLRGALGTTTLHDESWDARASLVKRFVDIAISLVLLFVLAPVLVMIAILIKSTSRGPVFFVQTRMGYGKRPFRILKFRTMVQDAETLMVRVQHLNESQGPTFKLKNDPRITVLGKFLRKTSLDEIPQLINVLFGDMSLVGPRPLPLRDYQGFSEDCHRRRFSVKPGITCLWQVMGRSSIGFEEWMALDMRYIDQWSVWLDIKILFQTIPAVFRGSGAV